uniref:Uncharacterized protein n=1 Tax=Amphimedon queenslandica TaxID=400682 RepID=A0A1X7VI18_AMPQE
MYMSQFNVHVTI